MIRIGSYTQNKIWKQGPGCVHALRVTAQHLTFTKTAWFRYYRLFPLLLWLSFIVLFIFNKLKRSANQKCLTVQISSSCRASVSRCHRQCQLRCLSRAPISLAARMTLGHTVDFCNWQPSDLLFCANAETCSWWVCHLFAYLSHRLHNLGSLVLASRCSTVIHC